MVQSKLEKLHSEIALDDKAIIDGKKGRVVDIVEDGEDNVALVQMSEANNKLPLQKFIKLYSNVYTIGDCRKAANKVAERVDGFKVKKVSNAFGGLARVHYYASNNKQIVDLTFPSYAKESLRQGYNIPWAKSNKNRFVFNVAEYEKNIGNKMESKLERLHESVCQKEKTKLERLHESVVKEIKTSDIKSDTYKIMNYVSAQRRKGKSNTDIVKDMQKEFTKVKNISDKQLLQFIGKESFSEASDDIDVYVGKNVSGGVARLKKHGIKSVASKSDFGYVTVSQKDASKAVKLAKQYSKESLSKLERLHESICKKEIAIETNPSEEDILNYRNQRAQATFSKNYDKLSEEEKAMISDNPEVKVE